VHLPREETIIDVEDKTCQCCGGLKHRIGEDAPERLDVIPTQLKVIVTRRPQICLPRLGRRSGAGPAFGRPGISNTTVTLREPHRRALQRGESPKIGVLVVKREIRLAGLLSAQKSGLFAVGPE
jgi:hypothetical protein